MSRSLCWPVFLLGPLRAEEAKTLAFEIQFRASVSCLPLRRAPILLVVAIAVLLTQFSSGAVFLQ